jgi:hypothetical protein
MDLSCRYIGSDCEDYHHSSGVDEEHRSPTQRVMKSCSCNCKYPPSQCIYDAHQELRRDTRDSHVFNESGYIGVTLANQIPSAAIQGDPSATTVCARRNYIED